jgi:hypothetical protein
MNLNGKVDRLLATARAMLPTEEEEREMRETQERVAEWDRQFFATLRQILERVPEEMDAAVMDRIEQQIERCESDVSESLHDDGICYWLSKIVGEAIRIPLPDAKPLTEIVQAYLDHPDAWPLEECGDCGLCLPGPRSVRGGYFSTCPVCGGAVGQMAWYYASREAARNLSPEAAWQISLAGDPLPLLVEAGYVPGTRLSEWVKKRQGV